jgi:hypothetical protein
VNDIGFLVDEDANKGDMRAPDKLKRLIVENKEASKKEFDDLSKVLQWALSLLTLIIIIISIIAIIFYCLLTANPLLCRPGMI